MPNDYEGSGYTSGPVHTVQNYLANRWSANPPEDVVTLLSSTLDSFGLPTSGFIVLLDYLATFGETNRLPQNIDDFSEGLANAAGITDPNEIDQIKNTIRNTIKANLSLEDAGFDQSIIAEALLDPSLVPFSSTFYQDVYDKAFEKFLTEFNYTEPTINGTVPPIVNGMAGVTVEFFRKQFTDFFFKFASVVNPNSTSVNFEDIYAAFFGTGNPSFASFLANYMKSVLYPTTGTPEAFLPNENIGEWMKKVQESYALSLTGSAAPLTSSVGESVKKTIIIDIVIQLIIKMIGILQKVAAMQSDRLRILTKWQSAYTDLFTQVPTFTQGDGTIFGRPNTGPGSLTSKDEAQKARDQANNFNQTMAETIRSRRTVIQDDAKVLQSNINQSNDSANDQASTATALIQTLSTLLAAIYR